uniref:SIS domain-containing protein n=1 Tax=Colobus angolensis palliatus TaxID=336983 RepID=A0A2K5IWL8_COLAP
MPGTKRFQHVIETLEPGKWELSGYEAAVPVTEKSNPLTQDLDKADAEEIVRLLGQCDAEIFQEEGQALPTYQRLCSESILTTMVQVAGKVQEVPKEPDGGLIVLSGGGTSGRMAFLMSVSFNQLMKGLGQKSLYTYLTAGGDRSVVASREGTEDSALHGIEELKKVAAGKKRVIVIGISVGLSFYWNTAIFTISPPCVSLDLRNDPIEDRSSTFRQVAERMQKMQEKQKAFVLNPAIGVGPLLFLCSPPPPNTWELLATSLGPLILGSVTSLTVDTVLFLIKIKPTEKYKNGTTNTHILFPRFIISTGAHVLLGKILQNHMLDLRISNSKLFWRALAMLQRFSGQSKARCIEMIHFPQPLSDDIRAAPISCHVQVAHEKEQVIPIALLSLLFRCSMTEAQAHLAAAPSVCEAVRSALAGPGQKRTADPLEILEPDSQ